MRVPWTASSAPWVLPSTRVENLKRRDIGRTLNGSASRIKAGDEVVVFYAGHGLQVKGVKRAKPGPNGRGR